MEIEKDEKGMPQKPKKGDGDKMKTKDEWSKEILKLPVLEFQALVVAVHETLIKITEMGEKVIEYNKEE